MKTCVIHLASDMQLASAACGNYSAAVYTDRKHMVTCLRCKETIQYALHKPIDTKRARKVSIFHKRQAG